MGNNTLAWNIIAFWFFFNISVGLVTQLVPALKTNEATPGGVQYFPDSLNNFNTEMEKKVNPSSIIQDASQQIWRIIDMVTLGLLTKLNEFSKQYLTSGVDVLVSIFKMFAGNEGEAFITFFSNALKGLTMFLYIMGFINLITGRNPVENQ